MNSRLALFRRTRLISHPLQAIRAPHDHHYAPNEPRPHDLEAPPSADEIIKIHYLTHYTQWEFKNYTDPDVDSYRYWLRYRFEHYNTETSPAKVSPLEQAPLRVLLFFTLLPLLAYGILMPSLKSGNRRKNNKNNIISNMLHPMY